MLSADSVLKMDIALVFERVIPLIFSHLEYLVAIPEMLEAISRIGTIFTGIKVKKVMENTQNNQEGSATTSHSNTIFGVSSDDIVQDLHSGNLTDLDKEPFDQAAGDKDQIVNTQDQQEIVNPVKDDTEVNTIQPGGFTNPGEARNDQAGDDLTPDMLESDETETPSQKPGDVPGAKNPS